MAPTYYHRGGDWWISAMGAMWHWVGWLAANPAWQCELAMRGLAGIVDLPAALKVEPVLLRAYASGGNEPKRLVSWCKCGGFH
jgi:hypothetical protein